MHINPKPKQQEHAQEEHIDEAEKAERKRMFSSVETPEEIEKWKEARRHSPTRLLNSYLKRGLNFKKLAIKFTTPHILN